MLGAAALQHIERSERQSTSVSSGFDNLLRQLAVQHESEVHELREEVARLLSQLALSGFSVGVRTSDHSPSQKEAVTTAVKVGEPIDLESAPYSLRDGPDADALAAAFAVAMDESTELEEVADLISHADLLSSEVYISSAGNGGFKADKDFRSYIVPCPPMSSPRDHTAPPPTEWWWDPESCKHAHGGRWPPIGDKDPEQRPAEVEVEAEEHRASVHTALRPPNRITAYTEKESERVMKQFAQDGATEDCNEPMGRWKKFINYAQTQDFLSNLPKLNPVWEDMAAEVDGDGGGFAGFANMKALAKSKTGNNSNLVRKNSIKSDQPALIVGMMRPFMLHPTCRRRVCWDMGGITLLLHDLIFIPMQVFDNGTEGLGDGYDSFLTKLDLIGASFWTLDIFVSFLTGYYSAEGFVELNPPKVAKHYMRSWLPMDLLIVSVDWGTMFLGMSSASGYMRLGKTVSRIMRVLRLLRFLKMNAAMRELMERINSEYLLQMVNLLKTLIFIVIINHYLACVWYGIGSAGIFDSNWPNKFLLNYPESFTYAYATALHWSLTQFTPASMEVVPQNAFERMFTIAVIIMALVAFSSFVSSITAAMTHIRQINARQVAEETAIRQFFAEHKVSHGTASRIWHFVRKNKGSNGKRMKESDVPALKNIPFKLREDLRLEIYYPVLCAHPFFEEFRSIDKATLLRICQNPTLTEKNVPVGEDLFRDQTETTKMIFVALGRLQYINCPQDGDFAREDDELGDRVTYVARGNWACEACLWAESAKIFGPFYALGGACEVVMIDATAFRNVMKDSEQGLPFVVKYAQTFMENFRDACISAHDDDEAVEEEHKPVLSSMHAGSSSKIFVEHSPKRKPTLLFNEADASREMVEHCKKSIPATGRGSMHRVMNGIFFRASVH